MRSDPPPKRIVGLIGYPIAHSLSPAMHNAAFAALGIAAEYHLWAAPTKIDLAGWIAQLRQPAALGANITIPHKLAVQAMLDRFAPSAMSVGAINTVVKDGELLIGHNTDADGLAAAIRETGRSHCTHGIILGSGGAARGAIAALRSLGAAKVTIAARRIDQAARIAEMVGGNITTIGLSMPISASQAQVFTHADCIINTTPVGSAGVPGMPIAEALIDQLPSDCLLVDLIVAETELIRVAKARGLASQTGLSMLFHQGALAWELWMERPAPRAAMRVALLAAMEMRDRVGHTLDDPTEVQHRDG